MVHYRRNFVPGRTFFFTATVADRRSSILTDHVDDLRAAVTRTRRQCPFMIDAIAVLPNHLHIVTKLPPGDAVFPNRWHLMKRRFSAAATDIRQEHPVAHLQNGEVALWQRRFWEHTIRDEADFERHVDYIHFNPVKHGLVFRVCDWPYSSFRRYERHGCCRRTGPGIWGEIRQASASGEGCSLLGAVATSGIIGLKLLSVQAGAGVLLERQRGRDYEVCQQHGIETIDNTMKFGAETVCSSVPVWKPDSIRFGVSPALGKGLLHNDG